MIQLDDAPKVVTLLALPIPDPPTPIPDEEKTEEERNKGIYFCGLL